MGTPGVALKIEKEKIEQSIKKHRGRVSLIADEFKCGWRAMNNLIQKHTDLVELLEEYRQYRDASLCDLAEDTLQDALDRRGVDMNNALKSAFFVLNNKGKDRGYNHPDANSNVIQITPAQAMKLIDESK
jgi:hypothetical protein